MTHYDWTVGPYNFTVYGGGTAARLRKGEYAVYWQGDDAAEAVDFYAEHGEAALDRLWDDYSDVATPVAEPEED